VGDVVQALLKLVAHPEAVGEVFNIGSTEEITIEGLAMLVKRRVKSDSEIRYIPYDQAYEEGFEDMLRPVPSVEKISKCIGWRASTPLDATIDSIAQYFEDRDKRLTSGIISGSAEAVA
jgi:UDP-glucose 4-epimerase